VNPKPPSFHSKAPPPVCRVTPPSVYGFLQPAGAICRFLSPTSFLPEILDPSSFVSSRYFFFRRVSAAAGLFFISLDPPFAFPTLLHFFLFQLLQPSSVMNTGAFSLQRSASHSSEIRLHFRFRWVWRPLLRDVRSPFVLSTLTLFCYSSDFSKICALDFISFFFRAHLNPIPSPPQNYLLPYRVPSRYTYRFLFPKIDTIQILPCISDPS